MACWVFICRRNTLNRVYLEFSLEKSLNSQSKQAVVLLVRVVVSFWNWHCETRRVLLGIEVVLKAGNRPTWADLRRRSFLPQLARCDELVRYIAIVFVQIKRLFNLTGPFSSYPSPLVWFLFELNLKIRSKALLMWTYCTGRAGLGGGFIRMANLPPVLHQSTCSQWLSTVSQLTLITACGSKPCSER